MNLPVLSQAPGMQLPELDVILSSSAESDSKVSVLNTGNVSSNLSNKASQINFNPIEVCEHKELCRDLSLHLVQESMAFDNVGEFCHGTL